MFKELVENFKSIIKNKYYCFNGRADRKEFWLFVLAVLLVNLALLIIDSIIRLQILSKLFPLAILLPMLGVTARRLHDLGKSGWLQLLGLIPLVGGIIVLVLCIPAGMPETNAYGEPVKR